MGADHDFDAALPEQFDDFSLLTLRTETAEHFDSHRIIEHALAKDFEMLLREHRRWREHRHLPSVHDGFEGRADGDLGFSKADIAADETVHWSRALHVDFCVGDCLELVGSFAKREGMLEFL